MTLGAPIIEGDSDVAGDFAKLTDQVFGADDSPARPTAASVAAMIDDAHPQRRRCRLRLFHSPGRARVAAIINPRLLDEAGRPIGLLGFFESLDDEVAAGAVLHAGADWLRAQGATIVRGPVNYTTWHDYRLTTVATSPGWFAGEPYHPSYYPRLWTAAGFEIATRYGSYWLADAAAVVAGFQPAAQKAQRAGVEIRPWGTAELPQMFQVATAAFSRAYMYTPIEPDAFAALGAVGRVTGGASTSFVALAGTEVAGFIYNYISELPSGPVGIVKTVVVNPAMRGGATYGALVSAGISAFFDLGVHRVIAAQMHVDGVPANMGWCQPDLLFKQYALYQLTL